MAFVGREAELRALRDWWSGPVPRPALVWGRRRVGKTALIERFAAGLPRVVFHTGAGEPPAAELAQLSRAVARVFPDELRDLASNPYHDWHDALDHLARLASEEPVLLVLDEFPELISTSPALPGILRAFLDRSGHRTHLRLLVCGSAVRTMWSIQQTRAPLYGRFDLALPVYPFGPAEAAAMLPELTPAQRALVYGIVGGMPLYLTWWRQGESVAANLLRLAGRPGSPLLTEGRLIMHTEVGSGAQTAEVLHALAAGRSRHSEIQDVTGADPSRILDRLIEARLVERVLPVTDQPHRSRRRHYRIADNFLAFYLGPLLRHRSELERGQGETIMPAVVSALDDHLGSPWEEAFRDHLRRMARQGQLGESVVAVGPWWRADGGDEIDAVVMAEPGRTRVPVAVGEAKWSRRVDAVRVGKRLAPKAVSLTAQLGAGAPDPAGLRHVVCAREEVTRADPDMLTVTAADIFDPV
ncbi:AAA family ATPase [Natronosporangium hydrolyticum]|uniref:AAA family ATPase n=1 Tax=Natronosporangium hydrolyticum TaxID=2811111 RepID=A0A895YCS2_9ACTN|nr:ATP-binding protein [Natronosporangium hydrolyticum]QSB15587.1 AAA family ATPase [Natronosporangium hydrolyticum]